MCDLSTTVGVPVSEIDQAGPTTTTTIENRAELPSTGSSGTIPLLALAFGLAGLGGVLLISRRLQPFYGLSSSRCTTKRSLVEPTGWQANSVAVKAAV